MKTVRITLEFEAQPFADTSDEELASKVSELKNEEDGMILLIEKHPVHYRIIEVAVEDAYKHPQKEFQS